MRGRRQTREQTRDESSDRHDGRGRSLTRASVRGAEKSQERYSVSEKKRHPTPGNSQYGDESSPQEGGRGRSRVRSTVRERANSLDRYSQFEARSHYQLRSSGYESDHGSTVWEQKRTQVRHTASQRSTSPRTPYKAKRFQDSPEEGTRKASPNLHKLSKYLPKYQKRNHSSRDGGSVYTSGECCIVDINTDTPEIIDNVVNVVDCRPQEKLKPSRILFRDRVVSPQSQNVPPLNETSQSKEMSPKQYSSHRQIVKQAVAGEVEVAADTVELECEFCENAYPSNADLEDHYMKHFSSLPKLHAFLNARRSRLKYGAERRNKVSTVTNTDVGVDMDCSTNEQFEIELTREQETVQSEWNTIEMNKREVCKDKDKTNRKRSVSFYEDNSHKAEEFSEHEPTVQKSSSNLKIFDPDRTKSSISKLYRVKAVQKNKPCAKQVKAAGNKVKASGSETVLQDSVQNESDNQDLLESETSVVADTEKIVDSNKKKKPAKRRMAVGPKSSKTNSVEIESGEENSEILGGQARETKEERLRSVEQSLTRIQNQLRSDSDSLEVCKRKTLKIILKKLCPTDYKNYVGDLMGSSSSESCGTTPDLSDILDQSSASESVPMVISDLDVENNFRTLKEKIPYTRGLTDSFVKPCAVDKNKPLELGASNNRAEIELRKLNGSYFQDKQEDVQELFDKETVICEGENETVVKHMDSKKQRSKRSDRRNRKRKRDSINDESDSLYVKVKKVVPVFPESIEQLCQIGDKLSCTNNVQDGNSVIHDLSHSVNVTDVMKTSTGTAGAMENTDWSTLEEYSANSDKESDLSSLSSWNIAGKPIHQKTAERKSKKKMNSIVKSKENSVRIDGISELQDNSEAIETAEKVSGVAEENTNIEINTSKRHSQRTKRKTQASIQTKNKLEKHTSAVKHMNELVDEQSNETSVLQDEHCDGASSPDLHVKRPRSRAKVPNMEKDIKTCYDSISSSDFDIGESVRKGRVPSKNKKSKTKKGTEKVRTENLPATFSESDNHDETLPKKKSKRVVRSSKDEHHGVDFSISDITLESDVFISETEDPFKDGYERQDDTDDNAYSSFFSSMADQGLEIVETKSCDATDSMASVQSIDKSTLEIVQPGDIGMEFAQFKISSQNILPDEGLPIYECLAVLKTDDKSLDCKNSDEICVDEPDSAYPPLKVKFQLRKDGKEKTKPVCRLSVKPNNGTQGGPCIDLTAVNETEKLENKLEDVPPDKGIEIDLDKAGAGVETVNDNMDAGEVKCQLSQVTADKAGASVENVNDNMDAGEVKCQLSQVTADKVGASVENVNDNMDIREMKNDLSQAITDEVGPKSASESGVGACDQLGIVLDQMVEKVDSPKAKYFVDATVPVLALPVNYPSADLFKQSLSGSDLDSTFNSDLAEQSPVEGKPTAQGKLLYQCEVCHMRYKSVSSLRFHSAQQQHHNNCLAVHDTSSVYECSVCKMTFQVEKECSTHQQNCSLLAIPDDSNLDQQTVESDDSKQQEAKEQEKIVEELGESFLPSPEKRNLITNEEIEELQREAQIRLKSIDGDVKCVDGKVTGESESPCDFSKVVVSADENSNIHVIQDTEFRSNEMACTHCGNELMNTKCQHLEGNMETSEKEDSGSRLSLSSDLDTTGTSETSTSISADNFEILKGDTEMKIILKKVKLENFTENGFQLQFCGSPILPRWKLKPSDDESKNDEKCVGSETEAAVERDQNEIQAAATREEPVPVVDKQQVAAAQEIEFVDSYKGRTVDCVNTVKGKTVDNTKAGISTKNETISTLEKHKEKKSKKKLTGKTHSDKSEKAVKDSISNSAITDFEKAIATNDNVTKSKSKKSKPKAQVKQVSRQTSSETTSSLESNRDLVLKKKVTSQPNLESSQPFHNSKTAKRIYLEAQRKAKQQKNGDDILAISSEKNRRNTLQPFSVLIESKKQEKGSRLLQDTVTVSKTDKPTTQLHAKSLKSDLASIGIVANTPNPKLKDIMNSFCFNKSFGMPHSSLDQLLMRNFDPLAKKIPKLSHQSAENNRISMFDPDRSLSVHKSPLDNCYAPSPNQSFTNIDWNFTDTDYMPARLNQTFPCSSTSSQNFSGKQVPVIFCANEKGDFKRTNDSVLERTAVTGFEQSYSYDILRDQSQMAFDKLEHMTPVDQSPVVTLSYNVPPNDIQFSAKKISQDLTTSQCSKNFEKAENPKKSKRKLTRYEIPEMPADEDGRPKSKETSVGNSSMTSIRSAEVSMMEGLDSDLTLSTSQYNKALDMIANKQTHDSVLDRVQNQFTGTLITADTSLGKPELSVERGKNSSRTVRLKDAAVSKADSVRRTVYTERETKQFTGDDDAVFTNFDEISEELDYDLESCKSNIGEISDVDSYDNILLGDHQDRSEQDFDEDLRTSRGKNSKVSVDDQSTMEENWDSDKMVVDEACHGDESNSVALCTETGNEGDKGNQRFKNVSAQWKRGLRDTDVTPSPVSDVGSVTNNGDRDNGSDCGSSRSESPVSTQDEVPSDENNVQEEEHPSDENSSEDECTKTIERTGNEDDASGQDHLHDAAEVELDYNDEDVVDLFADDDASFLETESVLNECLTEDKASRTRSNSPRDMELESPKSPTNSDHNTIETNVPPALLERDLPSSNHQKARGPPTNRWMPAGFCFHYCNNRQCNKKPCLYKHVQPDDELLIGLLPMLRSAYKGGNYKLSLNMIYSHEIICQKVVKEDLYMLFSICQKEGHVMGAQLLMKVMFQRDLVSQKVIDDFIYFRAMDVNSGKDMWDVFQMARSLNIQPGPHAGTVLLRIFKDNQIWPTFWEVLLYLTENEAFQVPLEYVQVAVAATIDNPRYLAGTVPWLQEADQQLLKSFDKQLLQNLCSVLRRNSYDRIASSLQYLMRSDKDVQHTVSKQHRPSLLGDGPRCKTLSGVGGKEQSHEQREAAREDDAEVKLWIQQVKGVSITKSWEFLANLYNDMCSKHCPLEGHFVEEITQALVKDPVTIGTGYREFVFHVNKQHEKNKRENPRACLDVDSLSDIGNELIHICYMNGWWTEGSEVVATEMEHGILSLHTAVHHHGNIAALALEACVKSSNCLLALQVLRATNRRQIGVPAQQYILGLFPDLMDQMENCGSLGNCYEILEMAFAFIFSGHPPLIYDQKTFSLCGVSAALLQKCLESQQWGTAVAVYRLFHKHSVPFSVPPSLKRYLLVAMAQNRFEEEADLLFEELKKLRTYPAQGFDFPRVMVIKGFFTGTEIYLLVKDYLHGLYNLLCEQILENKVLGQRDLNIGIRVEQKGAQPKDRTMMYLGEEEASEHLIQSILRRHFHPPLQTMYNGHALTISSQSLEAYLQELDKTGRRQGLVFQRHVQDRITRRGGRVGHQRINRQR